MPLVTALSRDASPSDTFRAEVIADAQETRVALRGELDLAVVGEADDALRRAERDGQSVVVDFRDLVFMDLAGLRLMLVVHERLGQRLTLHGCSEPVHRLFELTETAERLPFVD